MEATERPAGAVGELRDRSIIRPLRDLSRDERLAYASCLDVGCGTNRHDRWFQRFECATGERRYIGLDTDPSIIERLSADGVDARDPRTDPPNDASDLTLCLEVIEHVTPEDSPEFLRQVASWTRKCVAFTTPNTEFLGPDMSQRPENRECRWLPDHVRDWLGRDMTNPHRHKQALTPATLDSAVAEAFPEAEWDRAVFRAWPWTLRDESVEQEFQFYFKLFALAWRRNGASPAPEASGDGQG